MKNKYVTITLIVLSANLIWLMPSYSQSPEKMSYQAVVRDVNKTVTNQIIGMRISILKGGVTGTAVYIETQKPVSNITGLVSLEIGTGAIVNGTFSAIDWSSDTYFIKTEIDIAGGENYTITGVSQMLSVPYALYAKKAGNVFSGNYNDLTNKPEIFNFDGSFTSLANVPIDLLDGDDDTKLNEEEVDAFVANNGYLTVEIDGSISNEIQDLQLDGNNLIITNNNGATVIDLSKYLDDTDTKLTEGQVDAFVSNNGYLTSEVDGSTVNEIQDLQLDGNNLKITRNGAATTIDLSPYLDNTDTKLTESEVDAFVANNGYLSVEVDGSITNEIQDLQLSGNNLTITNNGTATTIDLSPYLNVDTKLTESEVDAFVANNGYLSVEVDGSITNEIQDLQLSGNNLIITNNGTATTIDLSPYLNVDTKLTESEVDAFVSNNGYLSVEVDGSITNEIQDLQLSGNNLTITNNGTATTIDLSPYLNVDTKLTESEVDAFVSNNGYLSVEVDGSITNEIQDLQLSGNNLTITNNGTATTIDLSPYLNVDTKLTESEVDAFVSNNGYLSVEVDGSITNEIQDLQLSGNNLTITNNGTATTIDLSPYLNVDTKLTESEVDAFVSNNGYLSVEVDGSITNEIQDLQLSGNNLTITNNGTATTIDLSSYLDDTDTKLTESEVDAFVANNGYLTTEIDGSITNEIELPSQTGQSGKYLTTNGTAPSWNTIIAATPTVRTITANTTLNNSDEIVIINGVFTATFPPSPIDGMMLRICTNNTNAIINGNGKLMYLASTSRLTLSFSDAGTNMFTFIYSSSIDGWIGQL